MSKDGILPDPDKIKILETYPVPKNADEVKRFVAFANYYRKFIHNFAKKSYSLNKLCRKNVEFIWNEECQKSFENLKQSLVTPPVLQYPNLSETNMFTVQTDASGYAIGAILSNGDGRPVAYTSRGLNKAETNYPTIEKELLAIVWAIKYFRPYLYGRKFKILTDHKPLIYLFNLRDPSSRLLKFRLALEEYDFTVEYVKGTDNAAADALSRIRMTSEELKEMHTSVINVMTRSKYRKMQTQAPSLPNNLNSNNTRSDQPRVVELSKKPSESVELLFITNQELNKLKMESAIKNRSKTLYYAPSKTSIYINSSSPSRRTRAEFVRELEEFCKMCKIETIYFVKNRTNYVFIEKLAQEINNTRTWTGPRLYVLKDVIKINDKDDKKVILNDFHLLPTSGHAGIRRMINNIKKYYFWSGLETDVKDYVQRCSICQKQKYSVYTKEPMVITTTANSAFDKIYLDLVGPLDKDNYSYSYILTTQCELTKYVEAYPLITKTSTEVAKALVSNFFLRYGIPQEIATDRGSEFISTTMTEVCNLLKIKKLQSTAYRHESIGALENSHKHLGTFLRIQTDCHPETWSDWLPYWSFSYNTSVHSETRYTPYELVFGKKCTLPSNLLTKVEPLYNYDSYPCELRYRLQVSQQEARNNLIKSKIVRKSKYDKNVNPIMYKKDDLVLIKNENRHKMDPLYLGPYTVIRDLAPNVEISKDGKLDVVHKNRTKLFTSA